ncbi:MAG: carbohydrate porin [Verrucomicrobiota bacterium]
MQFARGFQAVFFSICALGSADGAELIEAGGPVSGGGFGGPSSVEEQLAEDRLTREEVSRFQVFDEFLEPWFGFKEGLREEIGLTLGFDYTTLLMWASSSSGEKRGFGGIGRMFGTWALVDRDGPYAGSLVFKGENRHRLGTDVAPQNLGFASGYSGIPGTAFSDYGWGVTNLFWRQGLGERLNLIVGVVDVTDYLDVYGLVNPWTQFQNLAFLTDPTIPAPNQGLGAAMGGMLGEHVYFIGGFADANGDPTRSPFRSFGEGEFFKHVELGWVSSYDRRFFDNVHVTAWHVDERTDAGVPSGWGVAMSASRFINERWMPFVRAGYGDGDAPLWSHSVSAGVGRYFTGSKDLAGLGVNWGKPADSSLEHQWTSELFYRFQAAQNLALTPSVQLIGNPALNPEKDVLVYFGLRGRVTF